MPLREELHWPKHILALHTSLDGLEGIDHTMGSVRRALLTVVRQQEVVLPFVSSFVEEAKQHENWEERALMEIMNRAQKYATRAAGDSPTGLEAARTKILSLLLPAMVRDYFPDKRDDLNTVTLADYESRLLPLHRTHNAMYQNRVVVGLSQRPVEEVAVRLGTETVDNNGEPLPCVGIGMQHEVMTLAREIMSQAQNPDVEHTLESLAFSMTQRAAANRKLRLKPATSQPTEPPPPAVEPSQEKKSRRKFRWPWQKD